MSEGKDEGKMSAGGEEGDNSNNALDLGDPDAKVSICKDRLLLLLPLL